MKRVSRSPTASASSPYEPAWLLVPTAALLASMLAGSILSGLWLPVTILASVVITLRSYRRGGRKRAAVILLASACAILGVGEFGRRAFEWRLAGCLDWYEVHVPAALNHFGTPVPVSPRFPCIDGRSATARETAGVPHVDVDLDVSTRSRLLYLPEGRPGHGRLGPACLRQVRGHWYRVVGCAGGEP